MIECMTWSVTSSYWSRTLIVAFTFGLYGEDSQSMQRRLAWSLGNLGLLISPQVFSIVMD